MKLLYSLQLYCKVRPLARPRKGVHGNIYQPKDNQHELFSEIDQWKKFEPIRKPIDKPVLIYTKISFLRGKNEHETPISRNFGDLDNLTKAVNDALVFKDILKDDSLIIGELYFKEFSDEEMVSIYIFDKKTNDLMCELIENKLDIEEIYG